MGLDFTFTIKYKGNSLEGIVNEIKKHYTDPIASNIIIPNSSRSGYNGLVTWGYYSSDCQYFKDGFASFRFPGRFLFPTHYTLRGHISWTYQKKWNIYGYNSGEENDNKTWTLLGSHESTDDTFCGNSTSCNSDTKTSTFSLNRTIKGFEYIRFQTLISSKGSYCFITSATEFFGTLSTKNILPSSKCKVSVYRKCTPYEFLSFLRYFSTFIITK